ncbi:hypothetical protein P152DRAFT_398815 [Eremomyces bilateralis CBS 781.70]|uniref:LysM domain-containing protein n=1 Tax=Eremomyces bilateralis CBS 781.70 TaxID=1392243 RepID=A0A6G1G1A2_9PEZI|nr:uncharacterized protein P152DRAFT_398815 [Eremomyces bilateralis CBS 781.70]KAF1811762.1 hypothetical protein P152DRAFT_398815 [Eremomyces bilateralis CBS 781.70]
MSLEESCCTCAAFLSSIPPTYDEKTEKPAQHERRLGCCGRVICSRCITDNPRFAQYCPYCQTSTAAPSPSLDLSDPPAYSPPSLTATDIDDELPPPYINPEGVQVGDAKDAAPAPDVLHFINADRDSMSSLSLQYNVPIQALRRANGLYSDHLLIARRTLLIPGEFYKGGVSLSPRPIDGEAAEARKAKIRRWMVACKVAEYDIAVLYMTQHDYDLDAAVHAFRDDARWELEHPMARITGKAKDTSISFMSRLKRAL